MIDTATNTVTATVPVGDNPRGVAINPAGTRVYIPNLKDNNVSVINTSTNTVITTVAVGVWPEATGLFIRPELSNGSCNLTGYWGGTWDSSNGINGGNLSATLTESGSSLSGTVSITGSPCILSGSVSGTVVGNTVTLGSVSGSDQISFSGTCTGTSIGGTYNVTTGACAGDSGTFSLSKSGGGGGDIDPSQGTIGTQVDITNLSSLGVKTPKVLIGDSKCKVTTFTTSSVSCLIKKVKKTMGGPGTYDVTIQRKGKPFKGQLPTVLTNAFSIMAPDIGTISPDNGLPGDQVTITGSFFGPKKVKAFMDDGIGGKAKKGKVVSLTWDANTGASELVILVPKKLAPGPYDVTVTNKVGEDTLADSFEITP